MKKIILILITLLFVSACSNKDRFYLEEKYYDLNEFTDIDSIKAEETINNEESFIIFTYNNYCSMKISCEAIFKEFMEKYNIGFYSLPFEKMKETSIYEEVKFAPSIIIFKEGQIVAYLDANKEEDLEKYQDVNKFSKWIDDYIYLEKIQNKN